MSALVSTVSKVLKDRYLAPLNRQLNDEVLVFQILGLDSMNIDLDGNQAVVPLHKGRSTGIGARLEGETLPSAGYQQYERVVYDLMYLYGRAQFSGQAIQKTKTDAGAFIRVMTEELDRLRDDLALDLARQVYGDGTATIATISSGATSATQTLTSAEAVEKGYLYPGMRVDVGTLANPRASSDSNTINSVSSTTVVFASSFTSLANDRISREDNANASSVSKEIAGLQQILPSGGANTFGGLDASAAGNGYWDCLRTNVAGAISLSKLMEDSNRINAAGGKPSDVVTLTTPGIVRRLFETSDFKSNVRFVDSSAGNGNLFQGFESLRFSAGAGSYTLVADRLHPWGKLHFIDKKHIKVFSPGGWQFLDRDGLTIRWVSDKDAFQAVLFRYMNLGTGRRNTSLVQYGITDTTGY
jgi:hypothetical protein